MSHWLFYNIFRFECFIRGIFHYPAYVLFEKPIISNIRDTKDQDETFRIRISDVIKRQRGTMAPRFVILTAVFLLVTPWNLVCGIFQMKNLTVWFAGWIFVSVVAFIATVKADNPSKYLTAFKKNELKTQKGYRRSALIAFLIMIGIWSIFALSSLYFLRRALPVT